MMPLSLKDQRIIFIILEPNSLALDIALLMTCGRQLVSFKYVPTKCQIVDILTKPLDVSRFKSLRSSTHFFFLSLKTFLGHPSYISSYLRDSFKFEVYMWCFASSWFPFLCFCLLGISSYPSLLCFNHDWCFYEDLSLLPILQMVILCHNDPKFSKIWKSFLCWWMSWLIRCLLFSFTLINCKILISYLLID